VFISYKSKLAGVVDFFGDPRNTSRTCPVCGLIDKRNRKTRDLFVCVGCGHTGPADHIAAINIRNVARRAVTDQPYAAA
jgi:transposase